MRADQFVRWPCRGALSGPNRCPGQAYRDSTRRPDHVRGPRRRHRHHRLSRGGARRGPVTFPLTLAEVAVDPPLRGANALDPGPLLVEGGAAVGAVAAAQPGDDEDPAAALVQPGRGLAQRALQHGGVAALAVVVALRPRVAAWTHAKQVAGKIRPSPNFSVFILLFPLLVLPEYPPPPPPAAQPPPPPPKPPSPLPEELFLQPRPPRAPCSSDSPARSDTFEAFHPPPGPAGLAPMPTPAVAPRDSLTPWPCWRSSSTP